MEGFVWTSRARIAESRSWMVLDAPCIDCPPVMFILVFVAGDAVLEELRECDEDRTLGRSDMS